MESFLNPNSDIFDDRAVFANHVCRLIYQKYNGDLSLLIDELKEIRAFFDEHVRNIYELVGAEIPMFYYYELVTTNANNFDITEEEYQKQIESTKHVCVTYYA